MRPSGRTERYPQGAFSYRSSKSLSPGSVFFTSDEFADGGDHLIWGAQVGTMAGGLKHNHLAVWDVVVDIGADQDAGDDILAALEDQRASLHLGQVLAVIGEERDASELFGNRRISPAEAVGQFFAKLGPVWIAHDGRRHLG